MNVPFAPAPASRAPRPTRGPLGLLAALAVLVACSSPPPRPPNPTRSLDERRAVELILQAFREERDLPVPGGDMPLSETKRIHIDVASRGHKYGVAYVTASERLTLGSALPERDVAMADALQLVSGLGEDGDARILVLRDNDYLYDEHEGEGQESPSLAAENKLKRDVRDFLVRAHVENWP